MAELELFRAPEDLTLVKDEDLKELQEQAVAEFDRVSGLEEITADDLAYSQRLTEDLDRIKAEVQVRDDRANRAVEQERLATERRMQQLRERVHGPSGEGSEGTSGELPTAGKVLDLESLSEATARGVALALFGDNPEKAEELKHRFASLSATQRKAPKAKVPQTENAVTASVDIPGVSTGQGLPTLEALASAFQAKAKAIPVTRDGSGASRHLVASVKNTFEHTVDERTNPATIEELWKSMTTTDKQQSLVAGGGWCAPSEVTYDFFNIAEATANMIDLPNVGVSRGGIRFPVSPAIGDTFFQNAGSNPASGFGGFAFSMSNATDPWLWTESDDALTVTGSVNKPTLRVPCPTFSEQRLECYGISLTAGNLTDDAYPEATQNFIKLLRAAYSHAINARLISLMDTASTSSGTLGTVTTPAFEAVVGGLALAASDYRARYAMPPTAVLEAVIPYYIRDVIRADLALRTNVNLLDVTNAQIDAYFTTRNVRPQWVDDYQIRASGKPGAATAITAWPNGATNTNVLLYAAGTFLHGTGLQLDLGVIRDSVLNAENDYTALWAEECHLIAKVGHESRKYALSFAVTGSQTAAFGSTSYL